MALSLTVFGFSLLGINVLSGNRNSVLDQPGNL